MTHEILSDFRQQAATIAKRRRARIAMRGMLAICVLAVSVTTAAGFRQGGWLKRLLEAPLTEQTIALPDGAKQESEGEFSLDSADSMRDPVLLITDEATGAAENKYEIRFKNTGPATAVNGPVFYVSDRMMGASVKLMTALPASPQDFALMGSASVDERLPASAQTDPGANQAVASDDESAGWDMAPLPGGEGERATAASPLSAAGSEAKKSGSGIVEAITPERRTAGAREHVVKVLFQRPVASVLQESGLDAKAVAEARDAVARLMNIAALQPGYVAAFRVDATAPAERRIVQVSILTEQGLAGSIGRGADGSYATIDDPWKDEGLRAYAEDDPKALEDKRFRIMDGLYSAGVRNGVPPHVISEVIMQMARTYNLGRFIQPTDRFTVIYSEAARDDARSSGHILYASVKAGRETMACYVLKPGLADDYTCMTEKDTVIQRLGPAGFVVPVNGVLRSGFGLRVHPILGKLRMHQGVDWAAAPGTPVVAAFDGTIGFAGVNGGYGNFIRIEHANGLASGYAHLSRFAAAMKDGAKVKAGEVIGQVGSTGLSTGPHLHFELYANGEAVDPLGVQIATADGSGGDEAGAVDKLVARIIRVESGGSATAKNPLSSATGLGQFISGTWLRMMRSYRPDLYRQLSAAELLDLRYDPNLAREMVYNLAAESEADLKRYGLPATAGNLYLAHFLGSQGAIDVLRAPSGTPLENVVGYPVISANPFLYGRDTSWVIDWAARKMTGRGVPIPVKLLPAEVRIKNSRYLAYSAAIDQLLESIEANKPES